MTGQLVRTIHLWSALLLCSVVGLYALSGFLMVNGRGLREEASEVERQIVLDETTRLDPGGDLSRPELDAFARRLAEALDLRGRPERERPERRPNGSWVFRFGRPGTTEEVAVVPGEGRATLTIRRHGPVTTLKGFHHVSGFGGGTKYDLWALVLDVAGLSMLLFPTSGIYLWYRQRRRHPWGWLALGSGLAWVLGSLFFLLQG